MNGSGHGGQPGAAEAAIGEGFAHHKAGRHAEAEAAYRRALAIQPDHPDGLHLLGVLAHHVGRNDLAAGFIRRAIAQSDGRADLHSNLGLVLRAQGRNAEAEYALRAALRLRPDYPEALNNLGLALGDLGRPEAAEASFREAVRLSPTFADAYNNLGLLLANDGRIEEAIAAYRAASEANPALAEAHANLGVALARVGRAREAEASYRAALKARPDYVEPLNNLGVLLCEHGRWAQAEEALRAAIRLAPGFLDPRGNLAVVLTCQRRGVEAEAVAREAIAAASPPRADFHANLAAALTAQRRDAEAGEAYRQAIGLNPDFADAHTDLAYALLRLGDYPDAWREYEWRWSGRFMRGGARGFEARLWTGEPLKDRVLLLHAEQGLGDTLQFCRYAPLIEGRVVLEVQPPLTRLLEGLPNIERVIARGDDLPAFDVQAPLMSLPLAFGTTLETVPPAPYLAADPAAAELWRQRLAHLPGLKVGLVWAGEARRGSPELAAVDGRRSLSLARLAPLADVPGVSLVSLQIGEPAGQISATGLPITDLTASIADFADTAALVAALDLVISVDTAVVHLAGAMGKPVWLLNRWDSCWRWLLGRDDSPWYPSLRQFRQPTEGDWDTPIAAVAAALADLA